MEWHNQGLAPSGKLVKHETSRDMTKPTKRPVKTQISLGIRPVWSESSLSAWRYLGSLATHWAHCWSGWSESSLGAHLFCWFCHVVAQTTNRGHTTRRPALSTVIVRWSYCLTEQRLIQCLTEQRLIQCLTEQRLIQCLTEKRLIQCLTEQRLIQCLTEQRLIQNNLKRDPLEIQHLKFENSRLGFTESVHEKKWQMQNPSPQFA